MEKSKIKSIKNGLEVRKSKGCNKDVSCCIMCEGIEGIDLSSSEARAKMGKASKCFPQHTWRKIDFFSTCKDGEKIQASCWICTDCIKAGKFPLRGVKGLHGLYHIPDSYGDALQELLK